MERPRKVRKQKHILSSVRFLARSDSRFANARVNCLGTPYLGRLKNSSPISRREYQMTEGEAAEEEHSEINLQPLDDDCKLLGSLLDTCLKHEIGDTLFCKVSTVTGSQA